MVNLPFGFDQPEDSPGFLLWQTTLTWQRRIKKALEPYHVSHAQFVIMATLMWFEAHGYNPTQVLLANQTRLDKMTVSQSFKKLVSQGFVHRRVHHMDTRANSVSLTEKGKTMVRTLVPIGEGIDGLFFSKASPQEQKSLLQILGKLTRNTADD